MDVRNDKTFYNDEGEYGKYVVNKLTLPLPQGDPEALKNYERYAKRILWMDGNVVPQDKDGKFMIRSYFGV